MLVLPFSYIFQLSKPKHTVVAPEKEADLKIILLGDSAVGKSKLVERFLMNDFKPIQLVRIEAKTRNRRNPSVVPFVSPRVLLFVPLRALVIYPLPYVLLRMRCAWMNLRNLTLTSSSQTLPLHRTLSRCVCAC